MLLVLAAGCLVLNGCGRFGSSSSSLTSDEQDQLDYFYLVLRSDIAGSLDLDGLQKVKLGVYGNRLKHLLTFYEPEPGGSYSQITASLNNLSKKIPRALALGGRIESSLTPDQATAFRRVYKNLRLAHIKPVFESDRFFLRYKLKGDENVDQVDVGQGRKTDVIVMQASGAGAWPQWLENEDHIIGALEADETEVQQVGIKRIHGFPANNISEAGRHKIANALLHLADLPKAPGVSRGDILLALSQVVGIEHRQALIDLAPGAKGRELAGVVSGLARISPSDAIEIAFSHREKFTIFASALNGFELNGKESEQSLILLDKNLGGVHRTWIQKSLRKIGSSHLLPSQRPSARLTSSRSSVVSKPANTPVGQEPSSARPTSSRPLDGALQGLENRGAWMEAIQSEQKQSHAAALRQYQQSGSKLELITLPVGTRNVLVNLCADRMNLRENMTSSKIYGAIMLEVSTQASVVHFQRLSASADRTVRRYGLAGLMRHSKKHAVNTALKFEQKPLGMHDVEGAAELAGASAIPVLEETHAGLQKRISQMTVERALKKLASK